MAQVDIKKSVLGFAFVAFLLLAILFGMQIMTFIFGQLGPENSGLTTGSEAYNTSLDVQNQSLQAISTYTEQSGTQMSTIAIAITLVILIALFLLFWNIFIGKGKGGDSGSFQ